jgi:hypothetical protein
MASSVKSAADRATIASRAARPVDSWGLASGGGEEDGGLVVGCFVGSIMGRTGAGFDPDIVTSCER